MLAPIGIGDRPLGTLALAGPGVDRFTPDDTQLLSSVGRQIGVAVGNARLYAEAREREHEARVLLKQSADSGNLQTATNCLLRSWKGRLRLRARLTAARASRTAMRWSCAGSSIPLIEVRQCRA